MAAIPQEGGEIRDATASRPRTNRHALAERLAPYAFVAPFVVSFLVFFLGPALYSLILSFYRYRGYGAATWIGNANYYRLLYYHQFWTAWTNTVIYWIGSAVVTLVVSFILAVIVYHSAIRGKNIYKPAIFLPNVMAAVAAALVFQTIFSPESGVINHLIGVNLAWDQDPVLGKLAVIVLRSWQSVGWYFVVFLAGLTTINPELYDAARVDGASPWQSLWSITVPLMRRTFLFAVVIISIYSLRMFTEPNLLFSRNLAPAQFQPVMTLLYTNLRGGEFGVAAATAWLIFIPIVVVSAMWFRLLSSEQGE